MNHRIYSRIHPIGQGQCISESHSVEKLPFAKVYFDCGAWRNANKNELDRITQVEITIAAMILKVMIVRYDISLRSPYKFGKSNSATQRAAFFYPF